MKTYLLTIRNGQLHHERRITLRDVANGVFYSPENLSTAEKALCVETAKDMLADRTRIFSAMCVIVAGAAMIALIFSL